MAVTPSPIAAPASPQNESLPPATPGLAWPDWSAADDISTLIHTTWTQIGDYILSPQSLGQLAIIIVAFGLAWRLAPMVRRRCLPPVEGEATYDRRHALLGHLAPLVLPALWLLPVSVARAAFDWAGQPFPVLHAAESVLVAWVLIRGATSFIASHFWSRVITGTVVFGALVRLTGLETPVLKVLTDIGFSVGDIRLSLLGVLKAVVILGLFWWIAALAAKLLQRWTWRLPGLGPSGRVLVDKVFRVALAVVAILAALHALGINITALAVFGGAIGLGIGFGLQQIVANLISGFILLLDRSVKPGDVVAIEDKYGWINAIGARYVSVLTRDGIEHLIPNEQLVTNKVENWSHSNSLLRLHLPIGIAYEADVHRAIDLAEQAARDVVRVLGEPGPKCLLMGFGDSAVDLELRIWINDPKSGIHNVKSAVLLRVWDVFREHGIAFPFPQRDLHLKTAVPVTVVSPARR